MKTQPIAKVDQKRPLMGDKLALIAAFLAVAERNSFIGASHVMDMSASTISRHVAQLEAHLGLRLLERTTRHVALTEAGRIYHSMCNEIFGRLADAERTMASLKTTPRGNLRISAPVALGRLHVSPAIPAFQARFPDIRVEADFTDRYVDIVEEGYDVAVRIGSLLDSSLIARKIAPNRRLVVASPTYLAKNGTPSQPNELQRHECLSFTRYAASQNAWTFSRGDETSAVPIEGRFRSDSSDAIYQAVLNGAGIGLVATYMCHEDLAAGRLVALLRDWTITPEASIYVVLPSRIYLAPKVRAFSDFVVSRFRDAQWA